MLRKNKNLKKPNKLRELITTKCKKLKKTKKTEGSNKGRKFSKDMLPKKKNKQLSQLDIR